MMDFIPKIMDFKKRFCRYLLNHYLGQYLEEKFTLDQLSVDLYNGKGCITNVSLDCQALNQMAEEQSIPIEFLEVRLGTVSIAVPWKTIMTESCQVEVKGLIVSIQPKSRSDNGNTMFNSMFSSMASSMQLAEEFFKTVETEEYNTYQSGQQPMSGLEACAKTIEAVISRIHVTFSDSIIRVERSQREGANVGVALEMHIKSMHYSDESDGDIFDTRFMHKKLSLNGVKIYTDIFKYPPPYSGDTPEMNNDEVDNLILIANLTGPQEVRVRIKTGDAIDVPQISLDCSFGSLVGLLSPSQAHICYMILDDFLTPPSSSSTENLNARQHVKEKPMDSFDLERMKMELEEMNRRDNIGMRMQQQGWSYADECDDEFLPFKSKSSDVFSSVHSNLMEASFMSGTSSMNQSMSESQVSFGMASGTSYTSSPHKSSGASSNLMSKVDKTKFSISIASAAIAVLHEDILTLSSSMGVAPSTVRQMRSFVSDFFKNFGCTNISGRRQVEEMKKKLEAACSKSYLRIIAAPVKIEGNIAIDNATPINSGHVSFGFFELAELIKDNCLPNSKPENILTEILTFPDNLELGGRESFKIEFRHKTYASRTALSKLTLRVHLQECHSEFDMSVIDRLNALFQPKLPHIINGPGFGSPLSMMNQSRSIIFLKVTSPKCSVDFRFPIPDLRKSEDHHRVPYWTRNLRSDSIIFALRDLCFNTCFDTSSDAYEFVTDCTECQLFYKMKPDGKPYHFATTSANDVNGYLPESTLVGFDRPKVIVAIFPEHKSEIPSDSGRPDEDDSIANYISMANFKSAPSPFSSRRILHECLSHSEDANSGNFGESVIPGDSDEMNKFIEDTVKNVMYKVDCNLRSVKINMPSKEFFEELYNRLSMDLLLWEPQGPKQPFPGQEAVFKGCVGPQQFSMCKSGIRLDSESDSDDDSSTFYSPPSKLGSKSKRKKVPPKRVLPQGQSEVTINLEIGHGVCSFFTPFEDCLGNVIPEKKGQITLEIEQGKLFIVSGYKGKPNLGYLCVHSERATFFHNDLVNSTELLTRSDPLLRRTIYPSEDGVLAARKAGSGSVGGDKMDMLSVAVRIEKDHLKNIKNFKVAIGIKNGTIDYLVTLPNRNWFTQIVDFFDVTDVPIPGYVSATVITELHVHLWNCAASYSPIGLPMRCFLTVENFSISVNIAAQTENKVLRFIAEDAAFFISNKKESADLRNDYVCVMDMDLFEILFRICLNRNNTSQPQQDLKASNNVLHVRTCSDSIKMLLELLTYFARDGDLADSKDVLNDLEEKLTFPPAHDIPTGGAFAEDDFSGVVPQPRERRLSQMQSQNEQLHCMVAEAMQENVSSRVLQDLKGPRSRNSSDSGSANYSDSPGRRGGNNKQSIEIHFEADDVDEEDEDDENESNIPTPAPPVLMGDEPIMESSNGLPVSLQMSDEDEEEFCILENDPGVGFIPRSGEPEVRILSEKPIELIENYFTVPMGKVDILQAPKHYPKPVMRYTVQEMSLVWHLYGGEDFGNGKSRGRTAFRGSSESLSSEFSRGDSYDRSEEVDIAIDALNAGAVFSKTKAFESAWEAYESPKNQRKVSGESGNNSWRAQGGKGRRHDVLVELQLSKIKFQHEVYPQNTEQASRQVLVINSVEIKDKLKSSQFNKMMYLYTSPTLPKQSYANMVVVKAAHIRPDPQLNIEECCLKVSLLPIRLNIDQDTLLFLYEFFSDLAAGRDDEDDSVSSSSFRPPSHTPSVESLPVMMVNTKDEESGPASVPPEEETLVDFSDDSPTQQQDDSSSVCSKDPSIDSFKSSAPLYFREVIFSPDVPIRLDYKGKNRYNMTNGPIQCIVMALGQLESAEFRLIRLKNNRGILGADKVVNFLGSEWIADIKKNQVPSVLGGVDIFIPMHSFVQLFQGIKNLFYLPVEQYQKDGRLAKGLQRGVNAFSTSAAVAILKLTNRMVQALQGAAEFTYDMVSPGPSIQQQRRRSSAKKKRAQPSDIREGMTNAYNVVKEGLGDTAQTIVRVASKENEQKGVPGAVGGVLRLTPTLLVKPVMVAAEATSNVLEGFRSQLEPEFRKEAEEKWKE